MVVEYLKVQVEPEEVDRFIQCDAEIWTPVLLRYPGFHHKQVWRNAQNPGEIVMVLWWETRTEWKAVPAAVLEETDRLFVAAMGRTVPFVQTGEYTIEQNLELT